MASLLTALLTVTVAASALLCGVECHNHERSGAVPSAEQISAINAAISRMYIGRGKAAPLGQDRFEAHNPLEFIRMDRLHVEAQPPARLTVNTTELRRSG